MPKLSMTTNARSPATALWQIAGGLMDPNARALLLELSSLEKAGTGLEDPIRLLELQLLALYKRQGDANITQEEFDKQLLAIMEQIRKMRESQAKISLANAELARRDPNAFGPDALDPESLTKG